MQSRWHLLIRGHGWSAVRMMGRAFLIRSQWVSPRRQVDSRLRDSSREAWAGVLGLLIICPEMGIRRDDRVINSAFVPGLPHRGIPSFSAIYLSGNRLLLLHPSIPDKWVIGFVVFRRKECLSLTPRLPPPPTLQTP